MGLRLRVRAWPGAGGWSHLGWKWESPGTETRCHHPCCPHHWPEWGPEFLGGDRSVRYGPLPQHHSCLPFTGLTLPACASVLPRAWLSCTLVQWWRWGSRELLSCVQRGTERRGLRALITRKLAWDDITLASRLGPNSKYLELPTTLIRPYGKPLWP